MLSVALREGMKTTQTQPQLRSGEWVWRFIYKNIVTTYKLN